LSFVGIDPNRLLLDWVSASEAGRFAELVQEFTEWIRQLGPLETKEVA
jgi:F420-non-reducing hydrogenase iron-sulfur subunit